MSDAIKATGHPMFLAVDSWGDGSVDKWGKSMVNSWRTSKPIIFKDISNYNSSTKNPIFEFNQ